MYPLTSYSQYSGITSFIMYTLTSYSQYSGHHLIHNTLPRLIHNIKGINSFTVSKHGQCLMSTETTKLPTSYSQRYLGHHLIYSVPPSRLIHNAIRGITSFTAYPLTSHSQRYSGHHLIHIGVPPQAAVSAQVCTGKPAFIGIN